MSTCGKGRPRLAEGSSLSLLDRVIVHEVAHQWFRDAVGNDQVDEVWLDEALVLPNTIAGAT